MGYSRLLADLHAAVPLVDPSLLACDFAHLADEIGLVERAGAKILHLDVMDGHFVPNLSLGIPIVEAVRRSTSLPLDVHLMISSPERYVRAFRRAGADLLTFHIEVAPDPRPLLAEIRGLGCAAGLSLNPKTPVESLQPFLPECDLVLVMSVEPGFGGQHFDPAALEKLRRLRAWGGPQLLLSVDGGVGRDTIGPCAEAGADLFVAGTALFSQDDYGRVLDEMTGLASIHNSPLPLGEGPRVRAKSPNSPQPCPLPGQSSVGARREGTL
jgi:ribulose-phosphate 3-epimerase